MSSKLRPRLVKGFTLIELLIVVIIVAILAAVVVPQFSDSSMEAKEASLQSNLAVMRSAIEMYKLQHKGKNPGQLTSQSSSSCSAGTGNGAAGTELAFKEQLTFPTNDKGEVCKVADATYKYGPYLKTGIPRDSIKNVDAVVVQATGTPLAPATETGGWMVDVISGEFVTNNNATDSKGKKYSAY